MIWDLAYDNGRTTGKSDGAYNLPDGLYVLHDTGCKLSYGSTATTSTKEYQSELSASASVEGGFDAAFVSGEFSASMDYQRNAESQEESSMTYAWCQKNLIHASRLAASRVCCLCCLCTKLARH